MQEDPDPSVRAALMLKIGSIGGPQATRIAWDVIFNIREDPKVRIRAIETLGVDDRTPSMVEDRLQEVWAGEQDLDVQKVLADQIGWLLQMESRQIASDEQMRRERLHDLPLLLLSMEQDTISSTLKNPGGRR